MNFGSDAPQRGRRRAQGPPGGHSSVTFGGPVPVGEKHIDKISSSNPYSASYDGKENDYNSPGKSSRRLSGRGQTLHREQSPQQLYYQQHQYHQQQQYPPLQASAGTFRNDDVIVQAGTAYNPQPQNQPLPEVPTARGNNLHGGFQLHPNSPLQSERLDSTADPLDHKPKGAAAKQAIFIATGRPGENGNLTRRKDANGPGFPGAPMTRRDQVWEKKRQKFLAKQQVQQQRRQQMQMQQPYQRSGMSQHFFDQPNERQYQPPVPQAQQLPSYNSRREGYDQRQHDPVGVHHGSYGRTQLDQNMQSKNSSSYYDQKQYPAQNEGHAQSISQSYRATLQRQQPDGVVSPLSALVSESNAKGGSSSIPTGFRLAMPPMSDGSGGHNNSNSDGVPPDSLDQYAKQQQRQQYQPQSSQYQSLQQHHQPQYQPQQQYQQQYQPQSSQYQLSQQQQQQYSQQPYQSQSVRYPQQQQQQDYYSQQQPPLQGVRPGSGRRVHTGQSIAYGGYESARHRGRSTGGGVSQITFG